MTGPPRRGSSTAAALIGWGKYAFRSETRQASRAGSVGRAHGRGANGTGGPQIAERGAGDFDRDRAGQSVQAAGGQLAYRVTFRGQPVIEWSNLGLAMEGAPALGPAVRIESSQASSQDETWTPVAGKANPIRNHYNAVTVQTVETAANGRRLAMEARAYDDGVAFRYVVPEQPSVKELRILNESTQFRFSKDANTFSLISRGFQTSNEDDYHELTISGSASGVPGQSAGAGGGAGDRLGRPDGSGHRGLLQPVRYRFGRRNPGGAPGDPRGGREHHRGRRPVLRPQGGRVEGVGDRADPREIAVARVDDRATSRGGWWNRTWWSI